MLKTRIITALVLLAIFIPAIVWLPASGWAVFCTLIAALAAWEWGALLRFGARARVFLGFACALLCAALIFAAPHAMGIDVADTVSFLESARQLALWIYLPALAFWFLVVPLWMKNRWPLPASPLGIFVGVLLILPTWLALVQLRQVGVSVLLAVMMLVWLADIAAYFSGRTFGRHKLAPSISPGKTWEGAIGAAVFVVIYGLLLAPYFPAGIARGAVILIPVLVLLTAVSIVGDLFESLLKRQAGLKDSSNILPGHGGILDRIDSLTSTLPIFACAWFFVLQN